MRTALTILLLAAMASGADIVVSGGWSPETNYGTFPYQGYHASRKLGAIWANGAGPINDLPWGWPEYVTLARYTDDWPAPDAWVQKSIYQGGPFLDDEGYYHSSLEQYVITPSGDVDYASTKEGIGAAMAALDYAGDRLVVVLANHGGHRSEAEGGYVYGQWSGRWSDWSGRTEYPDWVDTEPFLTGPEIDDLFAWPGERVFIVMTCSASALWPYIDDDKTTLLAQSGVDTLGWVLPVREHYGGPRDGEQSWGDSWGHRIIDLMDDESIRSWQELFDGATADDPFRAGNPYGNQEEWPEMHGPGGIWSWGDVVDGNDLAWLGLNWHGSLGSELAWIGMNWSPPGTVPEPTAALTLMALTIFWRPRHGRSSTR